MSFLYSSNITGKISASCSACYDELSSYQIVYDRGYGNSLETPKVRICNEGSNQWGQATGSLKIGDDVRSFDCRHVHLQGKECDQVHWQPEPRQSFTQFISCNRPTFVSKLDLINVLSCTNAGEGFELLS